jgi:hypothetical protein
MGSKGIQAHDKSNSKPLRRCAVSHAILYTIQYRFDNCLYVSEMYFGRLECTVLYCTVYVLYSDYGVIRAATFYVILSLSMVNTVMIRS